MLKNILDTINKYNEDGTIIQKNNKFYWFNGKRYEFWCMKPRDAYHPIYYKQKLYIEMHHQVHEYKNKRFIPIYNENLLLRSLLIYTDCCLYQENVYHFFTTGKLCKIDKFGNWTQIDRIGTTKCYRNFLFGYENCIYVVNNIKNEKFNLITKSWSNFKNPPFLITNGCFWNNKFYILSEKLNYYDPKIDEWI